MAFAAVDSPEERVIPLTDDAKRAPMDVWTFELGGDTQVMAEAYALRAISPGGQPHLSHPLPSQGPPWGPSAARGDPADSNQGWRPGNAGVTGEGSQ